MRWAIAILLFALNAQASFMPSDRVGNWTNNVGVSGGIPDSSSMNVFTSYTASATAAQINAGIAACPSNEVVELEAGFYTSLAGNIIVDKNGVVLRGAGLSTILTNCNIWVGSGQYWYNGINGNYNGGAETTWTAGFSKGTTVVTLGDATGLTVGNWLILDALTDDGWANRYGYEDQETGWLSGRDSGVRAVGQVSRVTAIDGNDVTIHPPIQFPEWSSMSSHEAYWLGSNRWVQRIGIESLYINGTNTGGVGAYDANILLDTASECWIKGVYSFSSEFTHLTTYGAFRCEMRENEAYGTKAQGTRSYGYALSFCFFGLIEDNIAEAITTPFNILDITVGTVFAYNFTTNNWFKNGVNTLMPSFLSHSGHNAMNVYEGNYGSIFAQDFVHMSGSHNVSFRNRWTGYAPHSYPSGATIYNNTATDINVTNAAMSSVANLLGTAGIHTNYLCGATNAATDSQEANTIYRVGVVNRNYAVAASWPEDTNTLTTFYRHMDYDTLTDSVLLNPTNSVTTLPASLFRAEKPSYFGFLDWPAYNPSNYTAADLSSTNIPAGYRFAFGTNPPAAAESSESVSWTNAVLRGTIQLRGPIVIR